MFEAQLYTSPIHALASKGAFRLAFIQLQSLSLGVFAEHQAQPDKELLSRGTVGPAWDLPGTCLGPD